MHLNVTIMHDLTISTLAKPQARLKGRIKVNPNKNWRVERITVTNDSGKVRHIKNGARLTKKASSVLIRFRNVKTKQHVPLLYGGK